MGDRTPRQTAAVAGIIVGALLALAVLSGFGGKTTTAGTTPNSGTAGAALKSHRNSGGGLSPLAAQGRKIFTGEGGCGACHTLADAGTSGTVGPDLDKVKIASKGARFITQSIEDPNAEIAPGYPRSVMPQDFKSRLGQQKVNLLVDYLLEAGGKKPTG